MRKILLFLTICLVLVLPVSAQVVSYCGQLSAADCALMRDAQQSLNGIHSATLNQAAFTLGEGMDAALNFAGKVTNLRFMDGRQQVPLADLRAAVTLSMESSILPAEMQNLYQPDSVAMRLIDGSLYIDLASLEPALPKLDGWIRIDLKSQLPNLFESAAAPSDSDSVVTGADFEQLVATYSPDVLNQFVTVTRQGDTFETQVDFAAMYANATFQTTLRDQLLNYWRLHGRTTEITDANLTHLASEVAKLLPEPVTVYAITVDPETRTASALQYRGLDSFGIMIDVGASGGDTGGWEPGTFSLSFNFDDTDVSTPINAPNEVQPITEAVLQGVPIIPFMFGYDIT